MYTIDELNAIRLGLNSLTIPSNTARAMWILQEKVEKQIVKEEKKKEAELNKLISKA